MTSLPLMVSSENGRRNENDEARGDDNEEGEESPTELNTINSACGSLIVSPDKLSVKYTNTTLHGYDVGVAQDNKHAPFKCVTYYLEIFVKDAGTKGKVAIGFTKEGFIMRRQPGWERYHGDYGNIYRGKGTGEAFGTTGDTVAGGIENPSQEFIH